MITPDRLLGCYARGVFPMARAADDPRLFLFSPECRGVLPVGGLHISRSMKKRLRRCTWTATLNEDFTGVLDACANRPETWINAPLHEAYVALSAIGHAHSVEIWDRETLVGGVFGLTLGGAFFGESMFSARPDASKAALMVLSVHLADCGFSLFDTQYPTTHLASLGGQTTPRADYEARLAAAITCDVRLGGDLPQPQAVVHDMTQTS